MISRLEWILDKILTPAVNTSSHRNHSTLIMTLVRMLISTSHRPNKYRNPSLLHSPLRPI